MKSIKVSLFFLFIFTVILKVDSSAVNIVANGSFETITNTAIADEPGVPDGFSTFYSLPGAWQKGILPGAFFGADETIAVHGKKSLKISFPKGIDAKVFNIIF